MSFMASAITSSLSNVRYIETPVYVVAFIQLPGASEEIAFLGAFNTWFSLGRLVVVIAKQQWPVRHTRND